MIIDEDAEKMLLCAFAKDPIGVGGECVKAGLTSEHFGTMQHGAFYKLMLGFYAEGKPVDFYAIWKKVEEWGMGDEIGGFDGLLRALNMPALVSAAGYYIEGIIDAAQRRQIIEVTGGVHLAAQGKAPVGELFGRLQSLADSRERTHTEEVWTSDKLCSALLDDVMKDDEIRCGIDCIDFTIGPIRPGNYIAICGAMKAGKSFLGSQIAMGIAKHSPVLVFTLEMSAVEFWKRMVCCRAGIPFDYWKNKGQSVPEMEIKAMRALQEMKGWNVGVVDSAVDLDRALSMARAFKIRHGSLGAMLFDYLQLFGGMGNKHASRAEIVSEHSRAIKQAAVSLQTAAIVIAQLNDEGRTLDSRAIERDCNLAITIEREDESDLRTVFCSLNRSGPMGVPLPLHADFPHCRFQDGFNQPKPQKKR